jgi:hypothetical protein
VGGVGSIIEKRFNFFDDEVDGLVRRMSLEVTEESCQILEVDVAALESFLKNIRKV